MTTRRLNISRNDEGNNPQPVTERLKTDNVAIITVAYSQRGQEKLLDQLGAFIASPGYGFGSQQSDNAVDGDLVVKIQNAFMQINCFCPNGWTSYRQIYGDQSTTKFGVCLKPVVLVSNWIGAKSSCHFQWQNGYLVNEYSLHKHNYTLSEFGNEREDECSCFRPGQEHSSLCTSVPVSHRSVVLSRQLVLGATNGQ